MILIEQTTIPTLALPIAAFKTHLRLGTGFADDTLQDGLLESTLRAAIAMIEGRIGKVLIARRFKWTIEDWRTGSEQALPVAPVTAVVSVTLVDSADVATVVAATRYKLVQDTHRPKIVASGLALPLVPMAGRAEVVFDAGFGVAWAAVPADLTSTASSARWWCGPGAASPATACTRWAASTGCAPSTGCPTSAARS